MTFSLLCVDCAGIVCVIYDEYCPQCYVYALLSTSSLCRLVADYCQYCQLHLNVGLKLLYTVELSASDT